MKRGQVMSDAHRSAISRGLMGHAVSAETRQRLSVALKGKRHDVSQETRESISRALMGRPAPWARKEIVKPRHSRAKARAILAPTACAWAHIGYCYGALDCAHLDQNPLNNAPDNLLGLCRSHHFLYDRGRIDLANPVMPPFYVDRSGKRRYGSRQSVNVPTASTSPPDQSHEP